MSGKPSYEQLEMLLANEKAGREAAEKKAKDAAELAQLAEQANEELTKKLSEKPASGQAKLPSVTIDKEKYRFTMGRFSYKGKPYTAQEAAKDASLCKELITKGAGCLVKA